MRGHRNSELGTTADTEWGRPIFQIFKTNQNLSDVTLESPQFLNADKEFGIFSKHYADPQDIYLQSGLSPRLTF